MKITFSGKKSILINYWRNGALPSVKRGLYGDILTPQNVSQEHILPASKGGRAGVYNIALATNDNNCIRNDLPLAKFLTRHQAEEYLKQFKNINLTDFNGNTYIEKVRETILRCFQKGL